MRMETVTTINLLDLSICFEFREGDGEDGVGDGFEDF